VDEIIRIPTNFGIVELLVYSNEISISFGGDDSASLDVTGVAVHLSSFAGLER
jgi:hypothetical protein